MNIIDVSVLANLGIDSQEKNGTQTWEMLYAKWTTTEIRLKKAKKGWEEIWHTSSLWHVNHISPF